jgi:hypothetical protein
MAERKIYSEFWLENLKVRNSFGYLGVYERIILKLIFGEIL